MKRVIVVRKEAKPKVIVPKQEVVKPHKIIKNRTTVGKRYKYTNVTMF